MKKSLAFCCVIIVGLCTVFSFALTLKSFVIWSCAGLLVCCFIWFAFLKRKVDLIKLDVMAKREQKSRYTVLLYFLIILFGSCIYWLAYFPGGFNLDAYGQWSQAHGDLPYNDWHCFVSTIIIQVVLMIWDNFAFYIFIQILAFSVSVAFLLNTLEKNGVRNTYLLIAAAYIGLSPSVGLNTICMTKDVQFSIIAVNLINCFLKLHYSGGKWLDKWYNIIAISFLSVLALTVRHNGIFFVLPALILLLVVYKRKVIKVFIVFLVTFSTLFCIKGPVYQAFHVEKHDNVVGEAVGIPMAVLANAFVYDKDNTPEEVKAFMRSIASDSDWQKNYYPGEWDSCKWEFGGTQLLMGESVSHILNLFGKTLVACPQASYESFRLNTQIVWDAFDTILEWVPEEYIAENDVGIYSHPVHFLHSSMEWVKKASLIPVLSSVIWNTGFQTQLVLVLYCLNYKIIRLKKFLSFIPLFAYNVGTMLLLCGPNQRYFYLNAVLFLPIVLFLMSNNKTKGNEVIRAQKD